MNKKEVFTKEDNKEIYTTYYNNGSSSTTTTIINNQTNTFAILGLIFAFFIPLFGLAFSIVGLNKSKELNGVGKGISIAGIIISSIPIILITAAIVLVLLFVSYNETNNNYEEECKKSYECVENFDNTYNCKYEDEYGKEISITCDNKYN